MLFLTNQGLNRFTAIFKHYAVRWIIGEVREAVGLLGREFFVAEAV